MSRFSHISDHMKSQLLQLYIFWYFTVTVRLLTKHLYLLPFFPRGSVSLLFTQFSDSVGQPHSGDRREVFSNLSLQIAVKCIFLGFFSQFQSFITSWEEKFTRKILTTVIYACNRTVRKVGEQNGKSFKGYSKTKKEKKT